MEHIILIKKIKLFSLLFLILSCVIFALSCLYNKAFFHYLMDGSILWFQLRQALSILLLSATGYLLLRCIQKKIPEMWLYLFSFPVGACLWVFCSFVILLLGIPYKLPYTLLFMASILLLFYLIQKRLKRAAICSEFHLSASFIFIGLSLLVSTGFTYVFLAADSFYYFTNYGYSLTLIGNYAGFAGENSYNLNSIGQFLPLLCSYTSFWGIDQIYQIQAFLGLNLTICFAWAIYEILEPKTSKKSAVLYSLTFTGILLTSASYLIVSGWILANMYCMVFLFFVMFLGYWKNDKNEFDTQFLISIYLVALTLLRKDGIIFACFMLICIAGQNTYKIKNLIFMLLPSIIMELWWLGYVRLVLDAKSSMGAVLNSVANKSNVIMILMIITAALCYILFIKKYIIENLIIKRLRIKEYSFLLLGLIFLTILVGILKPKAIIDNLDVLISNVFQYPSSWGISGFCFLILLCFILLEKSEITTYYHFVWIGYFLLNFSSYNMAKNSWINWDDSFNRIILQVVPLFLFACALSIGKMLSSKSKI
ncbi:MAG TPA: hypothetical protein VJ083_09105 [Sedimentibacter sp.]|nr:hypothetical protein [Sedimentibacter sp.]